MLIVLKLNGTLVLYGTRSSFLDKGFLLPKSTHLIPKFPLDRQPRYTVPVDVIFHRHPFSLARKLQMRHTRHRGGIYVYSVPLTHTFC